MRKTPYTETGIKRMKCFKCGGKAHAQWQICSDGNQWRPICKQCDIDLNRLVLEWLGVTDIGDKMQKYVGKVNG